LIRVDADADAIIYYPVSFHGKARPPARL